METIDVGIIGTGWCGGIRAEACATNPLVENLHIAEINTERLDEIALQTSAATATTDYQELLKINEIGAIFISATPETTHFPMARDCLSAGKHVFMEKPLSLTLEEADELLALAGKVSTDLSEIIRENPRELAALLRTTKGMTSDDVARLAQEAEKSKNK